VETPVETRTIACTTGLRRQPDNIGNEMTKKRWGRGLHLVKLHQAVSDEVVNDFLDRLLDDPFLLWFSNQNISSTKARAQSNETSRVFSFRRALGML